MSRQEKVRQIIRVVSKRECDVAPDESLFDSGLLDSFSLPELVAALEQEFAISVPDSDLDPRTFNSLSSIDRYLGRRT